MLPFLKRIDIILIVCICYGQSPHSGNVSIARAMRALPNALGKVRRRGQWRTLPGLTGEVIRDLLLTENCGYNFYFDA